MNTHGDRRHARAGGALRARVALPAILLLWIAARGAGAGETSPRGADLASLSLEELMNVEVTLATRGVQKLFDAAAAVYVITAEDIRRSGASSIPEALRMVPGLHVARSGSSKWAISARGFTDEFANKLLVLVDGRTVYTPVFAGVFWDTQDLLLEDVARIEIIRGPGASLWGANAVNGIIKDLPGNLELDAAFYHASSLPNRGVPSWSRLDLMVGWRPTPSMELRAGLQDVLDGGQLEFDRNVGGRAATEIPRAAYARLQWRF
jgi:outer membrane receptor protein involved in Fe transport